MMSILFCESVRSYHCVASDIGIVRLVAACLAVQHWWFVGAKAIAFEGAI